MGILMTKDDEEVEGGSSCLKGVYWGVRHSQLKSHSSLARIYLDVKEAARDGISLGEWLGVQWWILEMHRFPFHHPRHPKTGCAGLFL